VALECLQAALPEIPVIGVIKPGAAAAIQASKNGHIIVIATEGTVRNGAYERAIRELHSSAIIHSQGCQLLVALAEEGWHEGELVETIIARYLRPILHETPDFKPDCLVLGCTHFPVLSAAIQHVAGTNITLVDSAKTTALAVEALLSKQQLVRQSDRPRTCQFLATDAPERFARIASQFLGYSLSENEIGLVDL
ncbi:MAG: glutamate racemase, partial [Gammaproteobacteria bacterium]